MNLQEVGVVDGGTVAHAKAGIAYFYWSICLSICSALDLQVWALMSLGDLAPGILAIAGLLAQDSDVFSSVAVVAFFAI